MSGPTLVTGATGFAGGHLIEWLADTTDVVGWGRRAPAPSLAALARWEAVDLHDRDRVRARIRALRPSFIYHCAGSPHVAGSWKNPAEPLASNVLGTAHLLDAVRDAGIACRVLVTGSATVYAPSAEPIREDAPRLPQNPYALSKLAQEDLALRAAREDGMDIVVARAFNHTGARQSDAFVAPAIAHQVARIERGEIAPVLHVGNLDAVRDLSDVRDVVRAYAALMARAPGGVAYNVASGVGRPIRAIVDALCARARVPIGLEVDPSRLRPSDTPVLIGEITRLQVATGWTPEVSFDRMLDDLLTSWRGACG